MSSVADGNQGSKTPYTKTEVAIVAPVTSAVLAAIIPMVIILTILIAAFVCVCKKRRASLNSAPAACAPRSCSTQSPETVHNYYPALEGDLALPISGDPSEDGDSQMNYPVPPYSAYTTQDIPPDYYLVTSGDSPPAYHTVMTSRSLIRKVVVQRALATTHYPSPASTSVVPISAV